MVEDLIKRLRDDAGFDGQKLLAANALEQQAARITALESERDALLAAAGKEAVPVAWMRSTDITELIDSEPETSGWIPLYTAPTAAPEKGDGRDAERYRWLRDKFAFRTSELEPPHWSMDSFSGLGETFDDAIDAAMESDHE